MDGFNEEILVEKLSKLNNSQTSIESILDPCVRWCTVAWFQWFLHRVHLVCSDLN